MSVTAEQLRINNDIDSYRVDYYERHKNDTETWLAETLNGSMRTRFEYHLEGDSLCGEDGGELGEIFDDAIEAAQVIAEKNPNLLFELRRRLIEKGEFDEMLSMAKGELFDEYGNAINTMVVVSDFPPELIGTKEDIGGYNAARKQTMLRVITKQPDGLISMTTQSLDGSNRKALEAIYYGLGVEPQDGELLEQRITLDLSVSGQEKLVDSLTHTYDDSLTNQKGGSWHAGIELPNKHQNENTYEFVRAQSDLIDWFVQEKLRDPIGSETLRLQLAATMHQRFENFHKRSFKQDQNTQYISHNHNLMMNEMQAALEMAIKNKMVFSGCGSSIAASAESVLHQSGYGNKVDQETDYKFDKKMHCLVCQQNAKEDESKKMCGPCGICESCDNKLSTKS